MKTWNDLDAEQQAKAINGEISKLVDDILQGLRFNDKLNGDDLQARIDAAMAQADANRTPWFAGEMILETCREEIEGMARATAEDAIFLEPIEYAIKL